MGEFDDALAQVHRAVLPEDLFDIASEDQALHDYRRLAVLLHPDRNPDHRLAAHHAFSKMTRLWNERKDGTSPRPFTMDTKRRSYVVEPKAAFVGDIANHYRCVWNDVGNENHAIMKMPRDPRNSDLMTVEALALRRLAAEGEQRFRPYVPNHVETFRHRDAKDRTQRLTNVLAFPEGLYSFVEVARAYPRGIGPKDAAWMWRRLLTALGFVQSAGLVHGAPFPEHILIHPEHHGLVLTDWCYSVEIGNPITTIVPGHRAKYPREVLAKEPATPATDIAIATQSIMYLLGHQAPREFRAFARGSTLDQASKRPQNAWDLKEEYEALLERMYGERHFVPFAMPTRPGDPGRI